MAFTFPLLKDEEVADAPQRLFGQHSEFQERYVDEEVQGGRIALIAFKQLRAQKPPNCLDRMQSTFSKQVAYNQRVIEAEQSVAGINCGVPQFLEDMTADEPVFVCINSSEEMKRNEQALAGQLWIQGDRQMTATNVPAPGMANTRESALFRRQRKQCLGTMLRNLMRNGKANELSFSRRIFCLWKSFWPQGTRTLTQKTVIRLR
jgi:hypothetical protein